MEGSLPFPEFQQTMRRTWIYASRCGAHDSWSPTEVVKIIKLLLGRRKGMGDAGRGPGQKAELKDLMLRSFETCKGHHWDGMKVRGRIS